MTPNHAYRSWRAFHRIIKERQPACYSLTISRFAALLGRVNRDYGSIISVVQTAGGRVTQGWIPTQNSCLEAESMSEKPRIVIHLGLPKTGTTYLQNGVYLLSSAINYLGKPFLNMANRHALQARLQRTQETCVRLPPPFDAFGKYETLLRGPAILDPANEAIVAIRQQLARAADRHKINLLLHEGYLRPTRVNPLGFDRKVALENLKVMVGDIAEIDILLTLRGRAPLMNSHTEFFWG